MLEKRIKVNSQRGSHYTRSAPPTTAPMTSSTTGFLAAWGARPDCKLPDEPDVVLASSGAPGVTTSTDVIVVLAPPGSVDVNVDVLVALVVELGVVVVPKVESGVLVAAVESEVGGVVGESVELVEVTVDVSTTVDVSEGEVGIVVVASEVDVSWVVVVWSKVLVLVKAPESVVWVLVGGTVVSLPDCCLFAIWTIDVANSGSLAWTASMAE